MLRTTAASAALRQIARSAASTARVLKRDLKVLAADPVDPVCAQTFADAGHKLVEKKLNKEQLLEQIAQYDGLVVRSGVKVTADIIAAGSKLKVIGRAGAGVDNIDAVAATRKGVLVMNTPGGNTSAAAELTMSLLMSMARAIPAACETLKAGSWERKKFSNGTELKGKTIGVVGLGMIGTEVARRCQALDMVTIGFDPLLSDEKAAAAGIKKVTLEEIYAKSDFITLHTPLNDATRNLINSATLAKCKKGVFIINAARGGIVNEADLLAALESGHVRGAAMDVYEQEPPTSPATKALIAHPSVVCTPHLGASTEEAQKKVAREIAQQMSDAFAGKGFVGVVNSPHISLAFKPKLEPYTRLATALGSLQGQIALNSGGSALPKGTSVRIEVEGPELDVPGFGELVKAAVLRGMLPQVQSLELDDSAVNLINAPFLAKEHGVTVTVKNNHTSSGAYANAIRVVVTPPTHQGHQPAERVATGAVIEGSPRVVQLDHWQSFPTFVPSGHLLLYNNIDAPGQVSRITSVLAEYNINIASLAVARQYGGGGSPALSVLMCDTRIPSEAVAKVQAIPGITGVRTASFSAEAQAAAGASA